MRLALKNHHQTCLWQQDLNGLVRHDADRISTLEHTREFLFAAPFDLYVTQQGQ
jgi:hypothetical protein